MGAFSFGAGYFGSYALSNPVPPEGEIITLHGDVTTIVLPADVTIQIPAESQRIILPRRRRP